MDHGQNARRGGNPGDAKIISNRNSREDSATVPAAQGGIFERIIGAAAGDLALRLAAADRRVRRGAI